VVHTGSGAGPCDVSNYVMKFLHGTPTYNGVVASTRTATIGQSTTTRGVWQALRYRAADSGTVIGRLYWLACAQALSDPYSQSVDVSIGSRALSFSDHYYHFFVCLSGCLSGCLSEFSKCFFS